MKADKKEKSKAKIQFTRMTIKVLLLLFIFLAIIIVLDRYGYELLFYLNCVINLIIGTSNMLSIAMIGFLFTAFSIILSTMSSPRMDKFVKGVAYENFTYIFKSGFITSSLVFLIYLIQDIVLLLPYLLPHFIILFIFSINVYAVFNCVRTMFVILGYLRKGDWSNM